MKVKTILILITVMCLLSSCSFSQKGIDSLLSPPKLSQTQNEIYAALEASTGKNIKLKYPKKGDFKSAFLLNNIDDEPTQEAIVFYELTNNPNATMPLRINTLDQRDGKWVSTYETGVEASDVEKVSFITSNGQIYIIIGFNLISKSEKIIKLFSYSAGVLDEIYTVRCSDYEVFDINGDGATEIIAISTKVSELEVKTVTASLYRLTSSGLTEISNTPMDPDVSEYARISKGKLWDERPALYLDGIKGGSNLCTEILTIEEGEISNLIYNVEDEKNLISKTIRTSRSYSLDLNKDGILEIPNVNPAPGYEDVQKHLVNSFTSWYNYKNGALQLIKTSYIDYMLGYIFTLPDKWIDNVTIESVVNEDEVIFYEFGKEITEIGSKLASFKVVKKGDYDPVVKHLGYDVYSDDGQLVYLYKIYNTTSKIALKNSEVRTYFSIL